MPDRRARAVQIVTRGKATFVAALPNIPTEFPIKIWSTMLYKELIIKAKILGSANCISSFFIGSLPKIFSSFIFYLLYYEDL